MRSLLHFNGRWYDPEVGRFITEDPVKDGMNWYVYCGNNPLRFVDKTGLFDLSDGTGIDDFVVGDVNYIPGGSQAIIIVQGTGMPSTQMMGSGTGIFNTVLSFFIDVYNKIFSKSGKSVPETATDGAGALKGNGTTKNSTNSAWVGNISNQRMYQLGNHFNKHGRDMGFTSKAEYDQAAKQFAIENSSNPKAQIIQGTWNGKGQLNGTTQIAITYNNQTVIIDKASGQIIDFYKGSEMRGLIDSNRIQ